MLRIVDKKNRKYYFIGLNDKPSKNSPQCDFILLNEDEFKNIKEYYKNNIKWLKDLDSQLALSLLCQDLIPDNDNILFHPKDFLFSGLGAWNEFNEYENQYLFSYFFRLLVKIKRSKNELIDAPVYSNYITFLFSDYWKKVRKIIIKRDSNCLNCGSSDFLQVHHLTYDHHFDEINHLEDLITLCKDCHKKEHNIL